MAMASRDRFVVQLLCPNCNRSGHANLSQEDGWAFLRGNTAVTVEFFSEGFVKVEISSRVRGIDFHCEDCKISALK